MGIFSKIRGKAVGRAPIEAGWYIARTKFAKHLPQQPWQVVRVVGNAKNGMTVWVAGPGANGDFDIDDFDWLEKIELPNS